MPARSISVSECGRSAASAPRQEPKTHAAAGRPDRRVCLEISEKHRIRSSRFRLERRAISTDNLRRMPPGLKKILIVDDTPEGLVLLRGLVERPLVTVFEANSGRAALQAHRREHADLILLDLQMPGLSGDEVARTIRADSALRDVSILMFADDARAASRERCMAAGANDFLSKPFKPAELAAHISQLLDVAVRKNTQLLAQVEVRDGGPSLAPFIGRILNLSSTGL